MNTIEAQHELAQLIHQREQIEAALSESVAQCDVEAMIKHRREIDHNSLKQYATRAKLLGLKRDEDDRKRVAVAAEIERIEADYETASAAYAEAIKIADQRRIEMQTLGIRLFALDQRQGSLREDRNEADAKQKLMLATWQDNALKPPAELACDLD